MISSKDKYLGSLSVKMDVTFNPVAKFNLNVLLRRYNFWSLSSHRTRGLLHSMRNCNCSLHGVVPNNGTTKFPAWAILCALTRSSTRTIYFESLSPRAIGDRCGDPQVFHFLASPCPTNLPMEATIGSPTVRTSRISFSE